MTFFGVGMGSRGRAKGSGERVERGDRGEQFIAGRWFRFDHYELENGFIRPAKGARLQSYDPFEMYERSKKESRGDRKSAKGARLQSYDPFEMYERSKKESR